MLADLTSGQIILLFEGSLHGPAGNICIDPKHLISYHPPASHFPDRHHAGSDSVLPDALQQDPTSSAENRDALFAFLAKSRPS
jgi:hypothetical protein